MSDLIRREDVLLAKFSCPKDDPYKQGWNDAIDAIHDFADKITDEEELNRLKGAISRCNSMKNKRNNGMDLMRNNEYEVSKIVKIHTKPDITATIVNRGVFEKETKQYFVFTGFRVNKRNIYHITEI